MHCHPPLSFDYQVRLLLSDGPYPSERVSAELVIETPITLTEKGGVKHLVQSGDTRTVEPILGLFQRNVLSASFDGLILTIVFDDQAVLEVPTSKAFQSWNLEGHGVPNLESWSLVCVLTLHRRPVANVWHQIERVPPPTRTPTVGFCTAANMTSPSTSTKSRWPDAARSHGRRVRR